MPFKKIITLLVVVVILGFLFFSIAKDWELISSYHWKFNFEKIFLLLIFSLTIYPINILSWHFLTKALGFKLPLIINSRIWMYSNLGRFLPGRVWQYPARVYLLSKENIDTPKATTAVVLETVFILLAGSLSVILAIILGNLPISKELKIVFAISAGVSLLIIIYSKPVFNKIFSILNKILKNKQTQEITSIPSKSIPFVIFIFFLQFVASGLILFILSTSVMDLSLSLLPLFIGIFALSWLLGYVSFISPSGLGIQEASITTLLSFIMPFPLASVIAILFRVILLISEALILLIIFINKKFT